MVGQPVVSTVTCTQRGTAVQQHARPASPAVPWGRAAAVKRTARLCCGAGPPARRGGPRRPSVAHHSAGDDPGAILPSQLVIDAVLAPVCVVGGGVGVNMCVCVFNKGGCRFGRPLAPYWPRQPSILPRVTPSPQTAPRLRRPASHLKACTGSLAPRCASTASRKVADTRAVPSAPLRTLLIWVASREWR
jgi:hypothetical protein